MAQFLRRSEPLTSFTASCFIMGSEVSGPLEPQDPSAPADLWLRPSLDRGIVAVTRRVHADVATRESRSANVH